MEPEIYEEDLELDLDEELTPCKYVVVVTGFKPDKTESGYCKHLATFSEPTAAVNFAWSVGRDNVADSDVSTLVVSVEEAIETDDDLEFVGTICKIDLII